MMRTRHCRGALGGVLCPAGHVIRPPRAHLTRRLAARRPRTLAPLTTWFPYITVLLLPFGRRRYGWDDNSISGGPDAQRE